MRCLIDTNIVIYREGSRKVSPQLQVLMQMANSNGVVFLVHPMSKKEIGNYGDVARREIELSKISAYPLLEYPPQISDVSFTSKIPVVKDNGDRVDNNLLYAIYKNSVDFLITEDRGIHTKAQSLGIADRVLTINSAIAYFNTVYAITTPMTPVALQEVPMHSIDILDSFFDPLRKEYPFDEWWKKTSTTGRTAWVYKRPDATIAALLILKVEDEAIPCIPPMNKRKRVKICTFMVSEIGRRIGELLLRISLDFARSNGIDQLYLTHIPKENDNLVFLIEQYGFEKFAELNREAIYVKEMIPIKRVSKEKISQLYYPSYYDGGDVQKLIIPILPEYYERLFPTKVVSQQLSFDDTSQLLPEQNTILKAYVCNTSETIKPCDILLFYRSRDHSAIEIIGTAHAVYSNLRDVDEIVRLVGNRTVYSKKDIEPLTLNYNPVTVILFKYHFELQQKVAYSFLLENKIIDKPTRSVTRISNRGYGMVKIEGKIDERFTVH